MLKTSTKAALIASTLIAFSGASFAQSVPESTDTVKVVLNDWTGQHFSTRVAGELLEKMGYNIEYVSAGALPQHAGLAQNNLHLQTEVSSNNVGDICPNAVASGDIVVVGDLRLEP